MSAEMLMNHKTQLRINRKAHEGAHEGNQGKAPVKPDHCKQLKSSIQEYIDQVIQVVPENDMDAFISNLKVMLQTHLNNYTHLKMSD